MRWARAPRTATRGTPTRASPTTRAAATATGARPRWRSGTASAPERAYVQPASSSTPSLWLWLATGCVSLCAFWAPDPSGASVYIHIKRTARANRACEFVRAGSESAALDVSIADGLHATEPYTYVPPYQYPTLPLPLVLSLSLRFLRLLFRTVASEAQRPCVISRPPSPFFPSSFLLLHPLPELLLCGRY